ncbi:unnamed protein product [Hymenolepis diminuta]|uniref:MRH domain-containing protein n=1 Tax=Hymenolepis diminuta TaxID=6216 RepID=A0A0R3SV53_HYMDI|nr:unnamed protein product [Hymenolepis diminuta]
MEVCKKDQVTYNSTPCAADGSHFIITFPKDPSACYVNEGPKFVKDCTITCKPGHYLNVENNKCELCPIGTAAPGNVYVVNSWTKMPSQFFSDVLTSDVHTDCSEFGWKTQNSYLLGTANSTCGTELTLENKNIVEGDITFEYKFTDPFGLAYFTIRNQRCVLDGGKSHILQPSPKDKWSTFTLSVPAGASTIQWYLFSERFFDTSSPGVQFKIRSIEVTGRAATVSCRECEPGYYSDKIGASYCKICPVNTYSEKRANSCTPCNNNEYAVPGSGSCKTKESCKPTEYVTVFSTCDPATNTQKLETMPIEPIICNDDQPPLTSTNPVPCKACPPGTKQINNTYCESCGSGQLSTPDGKGCQACPYDEVPIFGIKYSNWTRLPPKLSTYCADDEVGCRTWQLNGSSIFVGPGLENYVFSSLELDLSDGFLSSGPYDHYYLNQYAAPLPGTKLVFDFELDCEGDCSLSLFVRSALTDDECRFFINESLAQLEQNQKWLCRMQARYEPFDCDGIKFIWEFRRGGTIRDTYDPAQRSDKAIIYSIEMNNTRGTGAIGCKKCPLGTEGQFCKPCNEGSFYTMVWNETTRESHAECVPCPNGTMVVGDASSVMTVEQACKSCPPGTIPGKDEECIINLTPNVTHEYDFSTLFGTLGDKLKKAMPTNFSAEFRAEINTKLANAGWKPDSAGTDYHLLFYTKSTTTACADGISTIVTLRCGEIVDETNKNNTSTEMAQVQIPPKCAVGTCDGCLFHFMVVSPLACPICKMTDYKRIEGGCKGGSMEVTLLPPKYCHPPSNFTTVFKRSCPWLSTQGKIAVGLTMALVSILLLTIFYCYQRNKKLEYKYMKLVEGAEARAKSSYGNSGPDANQQGTECGIPDDEKETELFPNQHVSAITGGQGVNKWNKLAPSTSGDNVAGFGPVIFRSRTADDSHILTLDDGNEPI